MLKVEAWGRKDGQPLRITYDLLDYRDLETGLFAMNRTVGYTASIGAHFVASGRVHKTGVLSPTRDVPGQAVLDELARRNVRIERQVTVGEERVSA
ncbi:MAG: saccharopine dehydrogenase C-terminal domain-containing protein [Allosphingosinicella sp.]